MLAAGSLAAGTEASASREPLYKDALSVDPGKVQFHISKTGNWLGFVPSWKADRSMFVRGGFALYAERPDGSVGRIAELISSGPVGFRRTFSREGLCEGIPGGSRRPAPNSDDDLDGKTDEDRLDGIDNDGDGRVDEDFKAIGDDMAVIETVFEPADTTVRLVFHQESYAWSLPHIENMVVVSLRVTNIGRAELQNVRLGAFLETEGPLECVTNTIEGPAKQMLGPATFLLCRDSDGAAFALALLAQSSGRNDEWLAGLLETAEQAVAVIAQADAESASLFEDDREKRPAQAELTIESNRAKTAYGIAPPVASLAPGEEMRIDIALIAGKSQDKMESAIVDAYKTYTGDGANRFLPPPMSLTRHALWGRFEPLEAPQEGMLVTIENARAEGLNPERLSFPGCMPKEDIEIVDASGRDIVFIYRGVVDDDMRDPAGRIILKSRVHTGELFEITLRADGEQRQSAGASDYARRMAEEFWQHPGKLDEGLLSNSPNPFRESTMIFYEVPSVVDDENGSQILHEGPFETSVKIYNVTGQLVSILADWVMGPGNYSAEWNGIDDSGSPVASGVYYLKLQIEKRHITKRLTLVR
jgi:hypothetical protein